MNTAAPPPAGTPIRPRDFAVADEDAFEGRTLSEGFIREDPRTATAELGEGRVIFATEVIVAVPREKLAIRT